MLNNLIEIRWHARGGQGAKTAATWVAELAVDEGKFSQGYPDYGPERMGAPTKGYTRISTSEVRVHSPIYNPDVVAVLDNTLLGSENVCEGIKANGKLIINSPDSPDSIRKKFSINNGIKIFTVNATQISIDEIGRPIPNTPMIGALIKATNVLSMETIINDVRKKFAKKFSDKIIQGNISAIERGYKEVQSE
ncbi:MAG TPA: 2-oxoacid:acceptor oxidoreductase family protein [Candidatus Brocadiia bacterium]|nr:2-oxoacid:acceptor oxidoreductase family protein [Planctomycetota bacterium]MDO8094524.1 2-oxoacid:acceptor oxidoreductase family protein [Candidatus Brocadiales bacterium]